MAIDFKKFDRYLSESKEGVKPVYRDVRFQEYPRQIPKAVFEKFSYSPAKPKHTEPDNVT